MTQKSAPHAHIFSTAPQSAAFEASEYPSKLAQVARWSEEAGCTGILIYTDNSLIDPWLVSQVVIQNTKTLCPLVAVQPVYMHPYSVAKMATSLSFLHGRRVYLNMVAGGFRTDLFALCDETPHDERYLRLREYTTIIKGLLSGRRPYTFTGKYYKVKDLMMKPILPTELIPGIFISGSSEAGMATAKALGATAVQYPQKGEEYCSSPPQEESGIRIGIVAAEEAEIAWEIAHHRFPGNREGQIKHLVAMRVSDSHWHKQLSEMDHELRGTRSVYWLWPFKNYNTFCPYLVGSYGEVADELAKYMQAGFTNFILDIPAEERDLRSAGTVFALAAERVRACYHAT
jgi:alkanesulfonate monooxygenase